MTGLEPLTLRKSRDSGFDVRNPILSDPRSSLLAMTIDALAIVNEGCNRDALLSKDLNQAIKSAGAYPYGTLSQPWSSSSVVISPLLLWRKLDLHQPLSIYGMESMLAAEFRSCMYRIFKGGSPFLNLLLNSLSLDSLINRIEKQVLGLLVLLASEE